MNDDNKKNDEAEENAENAENVDADNALEDEGFDSFEDTVDENLEDSLDEELSEFEDWQGEEEEDINLLDEDYSPEEAGASSIEEDFSDFESQVISDQASLDKKRKSGSIIKLLITVLLLGGIVAAGAYGYFSYKDEILALINPPQLQQLAVQDDNKPSAVPSENNNGDINIDNPVEDDMAMNVPGLDENTNIESFLPQPTPISETDVVAEPDMLDQSQDASPSLSQVIDNTQETLFDPQNVPAQATQMADAAMQSARNAGETVLNQANDVMDAIPVDRVEPQEPMNMLGNTDIEEPNMNPANNAAEEAQTAGDFTDELYDPNEYDQSQEMNDSVIIADNNEDNSTSEDISDLAEVQIVNPGAVINAPKVNQNNAPKEPMVQEGPVVQTEAKPEPQEEIKITEEIKVVAAEPKKVAEPAPTSRSSSPSSSASSVEIPETKPKIDPYRAERNTTVYNLIQNQDLQMARRALSQKRYEDSLKIFERLYAQNPNNYDVAIGRALSLQYLGYNEQALKAYNGILASNPNDPIANNNKEMILSMSPTQRAAQPAIATQQRSTRDFANEASPLPTAGTNDIVLAKQAVSMVQNGQPDRAIELIEKAMQIAPNNPMHVYNAAIIYDQAGQVSRAIKHYERALELDSISGMDNNLPRGLIYDRLAVIR